MLKTNKMLAGLSRPQCTAGARTKMFYSNVRFVFALIQFRARHFARSSRRVQRSPARNIPYRCESCSQMRTVGYRWGKLEPEGFSVLMLQSYRAHNDPTLRRSHPVKPLLSGNFLLTATKSKPFGDGIVLAGQRWAFVHQFAHYGKELCRVVRSMDSVLAYIRPVNRRLHERENLAS